MFTVIRPPGSVMQQPSEGNVAGIKAYVSKLIKHLNSRLHSPKVDETAQQHHAMLGDQCNQHPDAFSSGAFTLLAPAVLYALCCCILWSLQGWFSLKEYGASFLVWLYSQCTVPARQFAMKTYLTYNVLLGTCFIKWVFWRYCRCRDFQQAGLRHNSENNIPSM